MDTGGARGGSPQSLVDSLSSLKQTTWARQRYVSAWLGIFLFDLICTLPEERKHIWNNKWTPLKVLYLLNRYTALLQQVFSACMIFFSVSSSVCHKGWWFEVVGGMLVVYFCALIMAIRVIAIYDRNVYVIGLLSLMLAGEAAVFIYCATLMQAFQLPSPVAQMIDFHGCIAASRKAQYEKIGGAVWSAPLTFDLVALVLTIYRCFQISQVSGGSRTPLVRKILSTGVFYFAVITASNLVNVVLYSISNTSASLKTFHTAASDAITSIMCSRLVLSLFSPYSMSFISDRFLSSHSSKKQRWNAPSHRNGEDVEGVVGEEEKGGGAIELKPSPQLSVSFHSGTFPFTRDDLDVEEVRPFEEAVVAENGKLGVKGGIRVQRETLAVEQV